MRWIWLLNFQMSLAQQFRQAFGSTSTNLDRPHAKREIFFFISLKEKNMTLSDEIFISNLWFIMRIAAFMLISDR